MKKILKFASAVLQVFAVIFGAIILSFVGIGSLKLSLLDIIRIGFGEYGDSVLEKSAIILIRSYVRPYAFAALLLLVMLGVAVLLNVILKDQYGYIAGIIGQLAVNLFASVLYINIKEKLDGIKSMVSFFGLGADITFYSLPVFVWIGLELAAFLINLVGVLSCKKRREYIPDEANVDYIPVSPRKQYIPTNAAENEHIRQIQKLEKERERQKIEAQRRKEEERFKKERKLMQQQSNSEIEKYYGVIVGVTGMYASMAYTLQKLELVFVSKQGKQIGIEKEPVKSGILAQIYYIPQYKEYCVSPTQKLSVFLESGQPLGCGRKYYLPRATKIYFQNEQNMFVLA